MAYLEITELRKSYPGKEALSNISFKIEKGVVAGILGPSGSGKTTLLRAIAGLTVPDAGTISIAGETVNDSGKKIFVSPEKRNIGFVFQDYALWPNMSLEQHIDFVLRAKRIPKEKRAALIDHYLKMVCLEDRAKSYPGQLSGGEKQRAALARAISQEPRLLLLDEPFANLDQILRKELKKELTKLNKTLGTTIIYVTHNYLDIKDAADMIAVMKSGKMVQEGRAHEVFKNPADDFVAEILGK